MLKKLNVNSVRDVFIIATQGSEACSLIVYSYLLSFPLSFHHLYVFVSCLCFCLSMASVGASLMRPSLLLASGAWGRNASLTIYIYMKNLWNGVSLQFACFFSGPPCIIYPFHFPQNHSTKQEGIGIIFAWNSTMRMKAACWQKAPNDVYLSTRTKMSENKTKGLLMALVYSTSWISIVNQRFRGRLWQYWWPIWGWNGARGKRRCTREWRGGER